MAAHKIHGIWRTYGRWITGMALIFVVPSGSANAADTVLVQAINALRAIVTMRADFTQTDANGHRVTGVMTLKRGGKIRFQYAPSYPLLVISDGSALSVIDTQLNKLQRWPIGNSPLGALLDPSRDVSRFGHVVSQGSANLISIAVRDPKHPEYGTLTLAFRHKASAPGGLELAGWDSLDAQNRHTFVSLTRPVYGLGISDSLFTYRNPIAGPHH